jgi:hypothetical protein
MNPRDDRVNQTGMEHTRIAQGALVHREWGVAPKSLRADSRSCLRQATESDGEEQEATPHGRARSRGSR